MFNISSNAHTSLKHRKKKNQELQHSFDWSCVTLSNDNRVSVIFSIDFINFKCTPEFGLSRLVKEANKKCFLYFFEQVDCVVLEEKVHLNSPDNKNFEIFQQLRNHFTNTRLETLVSKKNQYLGFFLLLLPIIQTRANQRFFFFKNFVFGDIFPMDFKSSPFS